MEQSDAQAVTRRARVLVARYSRNLLEFLTFTEMLGLTPGANPMSGSDITMNRLREWGGPTKGESKQ